MSDCFEPTTALEAQEHIAFSFQGRQSFSVVGGGTQAGEPCGKSLGSKQLKAWRFFEPEDMVLGAESGITIAELWTRVAEAGMALPLNPWFRGSTLGGLVAGNAWGPNRMDRGGIRDFIIGIEYVNGQGLLVKSGGRVVKNVTGYDLGKMMIGSQGGLGMITAVNLKLNPAVPNPHTAVFQMRGTHWLGWLHHEIYAKGIPLDWVQAVCKAGVWTLAMGYSGRTARLERIAHDLQHAFDQHLTLYRDQDLPEGYACFQPRHRHGGFLSPHLPGPSFQHLHLIAPGSAFLNKTKILEHLCAIPEATLVFHPIGADLHVLVPADYLTEAEIDRIRKNIAGTGGYLVLARAPESLWRIFGRTVPLASEYPLQQQLKKQLDPRGLFSSAYYDMV